jgi:hypothetical protein
VSASDRLLGTFGHDHHTAQTVRPSRNFADYIHVSSIPWDCLGRRSITRRQRRSPVRCTGGNYSKIKSAPTKRIRRGFFETWIHSQFGSFFVLDCGGGFANQHPLLVGVFLLFFHLFFFAVAYTFLPKQSFAVQHGIGSLAHPSSETCTSALQFRGSFSSLRHLRQSVHDHGRSSSAGNDDDES